ncbi:MAG: tRNA (adenosine(37)-N6)-threonylcarbamoyltransferase complex transferase subunit TsaD [Candidatus Colwellbacteria bacterium]|nr:tRNA (adenosine(37)-N6)-threonylcarbamoyltransferase complex transferase subunit TsaD [Candidatus Colwellbacteria bacterium]
MRILSIETSCDETAMAVVDAKGGLKVPSFSVIESLVFSQIPMHREFGGVVPNIAKREHEKMLPVLFEELSKKIDPESVDLISVTMGPGLEPALWTGIEFARGLAKKMDRPLFGANHLKGHLYSFLLDPIARGRMFPSIALIVSGGHTVILSMKSLTEFKKIGETRDDAAGEAFDKAARLLGLPYPGGPEIEKAAKKGNPKAVLFPRPMLDQKNYDMSFAGLKTSLLYYIKGAHKADWKEFNKPSGSVRPDDYENLAASFQAAIIDCLIGKTMRAADNLKARSVILAGGVAANSSLRSAFAEGAMKRSMSFFAPSMKYNTDNAAMIAVGTYIEHLSGIKRRISAKGDLGI